MNKQDILKKIRNAGVVGAGGAGFPTYKKLDSNVDQIIANGAECEPLLYKDRETMIQETDALFRGLEIMRELTGAKKVTIAVKHKNKDVTDAFASAAKSKGFDIFVYNDVYPAGDEFVLVYEITGNRIPPGGIPLQVGCVVDNTETIVNLAHAVDSDKPVTEKYITITGAVNEPITATVPVGTSFQDCIRAAGGLTTDDPVALTGGVMMGGIERDLNMPVAKTIGGLIILPADHYLIKRKSQSQETYTRIGHGQCDQCSLCTELCPRYIMGYPIEPHKVMRTLLMTGEAKERGSLWAQHCCECNVCSLIACPESLDPKNICVDSKKLLREKNLTFTPEELDRAFRDVHPARHGREIPIATLYQKLGLKMYDRYAHFTKLNFTPEQVTIPLNSHIGKPAEPNVKIGDRVKKGDRIGAVKADALGCPVHASIDGIVKDITSAGIRITAN
jgi:Na+-translocating ferredoxin:NAD+ oxidoreductase RnfC subunit